MFEDWLKSNLIEHKKVTKNLFKIGGDLFFEITPKKNVLIDDEMNLILSRKEKQFIKELGINFVYYEFGGRYYYTKAGKEKADFTDLKYLGNCVKQIPMKFAFLGTHQEYELTVGMQNAVQWAMKAKFVGADAIAITDKNTLAGTLSFQSSCKKIGIKHIIGETVSVKFHSGLFDFKFYAKNKRGWGSLLRINKALNVDNDKFIEVFDLFKHTEGLICVIPQIHPFTKEGNFVKKFMEAFGDDLYIQVSSNEFLSNKVDEKSLKFLEHNFDFYFNQIKPVWIDDAYYCDEDDFELKKNLLEVGGVAKPQSKDEYLKLPEKAILKFKPIFKSLDKMLGLFKRSCDNTIEIADKCDFDIETGNHRLPKFEAVSMSEVEGDIEEYQKNNNLFWGSRSIEKDNNEALFLYELEQGFLKKVVEVIPKQYHKEYRDRLNTEIDVIVSAGFCDYFLILWDVVLWCEKNDYLVGNARGSVAGSLVAYLLNITDVDPIKYGLLFERFLNKTRVSGERAKSADALPDIDMDFEAAHRDDVKAYLSYKYGKDYVCSIGAYDRIKLKSGLKDFGKIEGLTFSYTNFITSFIGHQVKYKWEDLFKYAKQNPKFREFVQKYPQIINDLKTVMNGAKTASVHASAVIIVPKEDNEGNPMEIYDWMPVKKMVIKGGSMEVLVSEWEGKYIDKAGFLKEDILGLTQLDKFKRIKQLIRQYKGENEDVVLRDIPLADSTVLKYYGRGFVEDVFQFGSDGLRNYCKKLKPAELDHIIAANALYRPGPMSSNAHEDFVKILNGKKKPQYDRHLQPVTGETVGLYVYQEQIMKAVNVLGGLTLSEADEVRTVMKKFDKVKMATFREKFIKGAINRGCSEKEAVGVWEKLERFSGYGFNKSHATAYSIMSYWSMWLKVYHPLMFWVTSLEFSSDTTIAYRIFEMQKIDKEYKISPPDVNQSQKTFAPNIAEKSIFWSLLKIKGLADKTVDKIILERKKGHFKSVIDFMLRMKGTGVGKSACEALILSGGFDNVYKLNGIVKRLDLLQELYKLYQKPLPKLYKTDNINAVESILITKQREYTGYGIVDYKRVLEQKGKFLSKYYTETVQAHSTKLAKNQKKKVVMAGFIDMLRERDSKRGKFASIKLRCNDGFIDVVLWNETWTKNKKIVEEVFSKNGQIAIRGNLVRDNWRNSNAIHSNNETKIYSI